MPEIETEIEMTETKIFGSKLVLSCNYGEFILVNSIRNIC